jgi:hypothetical protein
MATNRTRRKRKGTRTVGDFLDDGSEFARMLDGGSNWTDDEAAAFWEANKKEIMTLFMQRAEAEGRPGKRPDDYMHELAETRPRLITRETEYYGPWHNGPPKKPTMCPVYETDYEYLKRLGLLVAWELEGK